MTHPGGDTALLHLVAGAMAPHGKVAVAVSGGGDSMALLHLALRVAARDGQSLQAVTVDHGLRAASGAEAAGVAVWCAAQGIAHDTLRWLGPAPTGNLMDQARRARLALMGDWAVGQGIGQILLGHTADDQAESFLMNLSRAAGLDGLSGMRGQWHEHGIGWCRPLLSVLRPHLRAYLRNHGVAWVDDPSNEDPRFTRVRARQIMAALAPLGITADRVARSMGNLADSRMALRQALAQAVAAHVAEVAGALILPRRALAGIGPELQRRLWIAAIRWMSGAVYPARAEQLAGLMQRIAAGADATLGGLCFRGRGDDLVITREPAAVSAAAPLGQIWDHRWQVRGPDLPGAEIRALGAAGLRQCPHWRETGLLRDALLVSPAIWHQGQLIAAPFAGLAQGFCATMRPSFGMFILAH